MTDYGLLQSIKIDFDPEPMFVVTMSISGKKMMVFVFRVIAAK